MQFKYVDTAEIEVSVSMTTGQITRLIEWMTDHHATLEDGSLSKLTLGYRIKDMKNAREQAVFQIAKYAEGYKTNV